MSATADWPAPLSELSDVELFNDAKALGFAFELRPVVLALKAGPRLWESLEIGTPPLGADRYATRRACAMMREMKRRGGRWYAFLRVHLRK